MYTLNTTKSCVWMRILHNFWLPCPSAGLWSMRWGWAEPFPYIVHCNIVTRSHYNIIHYKYAGAGHQQSGESGELGNYAPMSRFRPRTHRHRLIILWSEESVARTHCGHSARGSASSHYQEGSMNSKSLSPYHYHYHGDQVWPAIIIIIHYSSHHHLTRHTCGHWTHINTVPPSAIRLPS